MGCTPPGFPSVTRSGTSRVCTRVFVIKHNANQRLRHQPRLLLSSTACAPQHPLPGQHSPLPPPYLATVLSVPCAEVTEQQQTAY